MLEVDYALAIPVASQNYGYPTKGTPGRQGHSVVAIALHITAGPLKPSLDWLRDPQSQVSAHYVVSKAGFIYQLVREADAAWSNGWRTLKTDGHATTLDEKRALYEPQESVDWISAALLGNVNPNLLTVSIETEGVPGELRPPRQLTSIIELMLDIRDRQALLAIPNRVCGHNALDSINRPDCPGFDGKDWHAIYSAWLLPKWARLPATEANE